jgi:hypothetical protein
MVGLAPFTKVSLTKLCIALFSFLILNSHLEGSPHGDTRTRLMEPCGSLPHKCSIFICYFYFNSHLEGSGEKASTRPARSPMVTCSQAGCRAGGIRGVAGSGQTDTCVASGKPSKT